MSRRIGALIGHGISPIVESLDVNAIVNEIDLDEVLANVDMDRLMERIDIKRLLDRVDWNAILERVDVNHHLERIDMDRLLDNVDIDRVIERSNLEEIVSRASSGVFSEFIDMLRTRIAWIDQWGQRLCRCRCFAQRPHLPPRPGRPQDDKTVWPISSGWRAREFGVAVQFRTCGGLCRLASWFIDASFLALTFAAFSWIASRIAIAFTNDPLWTIQDEREWLMAFLFALYSLFYNFCMLACFGRTIGMWVLGLLLVSRDGHRIQACQSFLFAFFVPLNLPLFGWIMTFMTRHGRMWNELLSFTATVYAWDAKEKPKQYADLAMSLNEYTLEKLPKNSNSRRRFLAKNINNTVDEKTDYLQRNGKCDDKNDIEHQ